MTEQTRALITGIDGFTGRYLAAELQLAGYRVFGTATRSDPDSGLFLTDLRDKEALAHTVERVKPHLVAHLAGISFVGHGDADAFYEVNLIGTRNLLEALYRLNPQPSCVLLASSANVYGNNRGGVLSEDTPINPANDYAVSKAGMEYMARLWMDKLPIVITRPFNYTGVGQSDQFVLPKIVSHFKRRAPRIELGNLDVSRDFSDVRTVAKAYRNLLDGKHAGSTVNICTGEAHSLRGILEMVERISGHSAEIATNPAFVRSNEVISLCGDTTQLKALLPTWENPPLEDTLRWMLFSP